ncbi:MAG TPA: hypothetical protein VGL70_20265 [Candidatus Binatia bacterium]|jgi:hypothetical protein
MRHAYRNRCARIVLILAIMAAGWGAAPALAVPPAREVSLKQLIPLASSRREFKIIDGKDRGKMVPLIFQSDPADEKRWKLIFGDYGRIFLVSAPGGALMMERMDLFKSKSTIVYEPALAILLPGETDSSGALQRETRYKMYRADTGKLRRSGRVTHLVKRISNSLFETPAGRIDGYHIEIEHRMDMEYYSELFLTVGLGCRLDEGIIYGSVQSKLKKLGGIVTETKTATAALASTVR